MNKNKTLIAILSVAVFVAVGVMLAQENGVQAQGQNQDQIMNGMGGEQTQQGNQIQNQNQIQTENQGEDQQLNIEAQTQEEANIGEEQDTGSQRRSATAREHMSVVAQEVEKLLSNEDLEEGIGEQVREVAQQQKQAQEQIRAYMDEMEGKRLWAKRFFGPDYGAIRNIEKQIEQNQLRIQQLEQLQNQALNQGDETQIQELTQALIEQNTALEEQIRTEEQIKSIFGWLFRIFSR